ncbi:MAG: hypothetical protein K2N84_03580 [Clostridia bacterium]|nr:hypothetical protein [Clostridia bacterium]
MGRKSVAILDVRTSEIAVVLGERGVNNTFVFKASKTEPFDGYDEDGVFYDETALKKAVASAVSATEQICGERIREIFVGVPGAFCTVRKTERTIGFPKKRKIGQAEIDMLFNSGDEPLEGYRRIRAASMIYTTGDNRRAVDPTGIASSVLSGELSYFYCKEEFAALFEEMFSKMKITPYFLPAQYAMATYLIPSETRDEGALFLDVGFLSSSVLVLLGNGVCAQKTFWVGEGHLAEYLMEQLSVPYEVAYMLLSKANLYAKGDVGSKEFVIGGNSYDIDMGQLAEKVKDGLDELFCEKIGAFIQDNAGRELDYKPLYVSGEGLCGIRGALEHVSKRIERVCEQLAPDLPYYNKPSMSSRIALLDMACGDSRKTGVLYRLINKFGG